MDDISYNRKLWILFRSCFLISLSTFGGGLVIISMLRKKFVEELQWIGETEIMDMIAIAQSCPGVMAVNTSIIIGYRLGSIPGTVLAVTGTILPPMIILSLISVFYTQFRSNRVIALLLKGMQAGVAAVMIHMAINFCGNIFKTKSTLAIALLICGAIGMTFLGVDVITVILICGVIGGMNTVLQMKKSKNQKQAEP